MARSGDVLVDERASVARQSSTLTPGLLGDSTRRGTVDAALSAPRLETASRTRLKTVVSARMAAGCRPASGQGHQRTDAHRRTRLLGRGAERGRRCSRDGCQRADDSAETGLIARQYIRQHGAPNTGLDGHQDSDLRRSPRPDATLRRNQPRRRVGDGASFDPGRRTQQRAPSVARQMHGCEALTSEARSERPVDDPSAVPPPRCLWHRWTRLAGVWA